MPTRFLLWSFLGCALCAGVLIGSIAPLDAPPIKGLNDKWHHLLAYAILASWWGIQTNISIKSTISMIATLALFGAIIEVFQLFTPHRSFDFVDMIFNASGAVIGALIASVALRIEAVKRFAGTTRREHSLPSHNT